VQDVDIGADITGLPKRGGVPEKLIDAFLFQSSQTRLFRAGGRDSAAALFLLELRSGLNPPF
jgi:hypothetical protein